jgi:hypothetical protein
MDRKNLPDKRSDKAMKKVFEIAVLAFALIVGIKVGQKIIS